MTRHSTRIAAWTAVALLLLAVAVWSVARLVDRPAAAQATPRPIADRGALLPTEQVINDLFERSRPAVVFITMEQRVVDAWTRNTLDIPRGSGSGFIWDDRGHIVTNNHVVSGASGARVRLSDGREVAASLVGVSAAHDLAVIRVDVPKLPPPLPIGRSADLRVGQLTLAIGNPFGLG
jgi:S1-C subfamily serine protease